jgi:phage terminase large subunit-like protein
MDTGSMDPSDRVVRFINNLTHSSGDYGRQPFNLRPWQERIVRELFLVEPKTGKRKHRTALLMFPRKNGKTELAAALALYGLMGDGEVGAQVILAAADREQAGHVYNAAIAMVRADPELDSEQGGCLEIIESQKRIVHRASGSVLKAIAAEAFSKHGFNASMVIYDELHAAPNRELWDVLRTSQGGRSQPLMIAISTAGYDRNSILAKVYDYACKVRDGIVEDPTFLPVIYEAPKEADWLDEQVWFAANPALGDFRDLAEMRNFAREAKEMPGSENTFRRLYLNQWTEQATRWLSMATWDLGQVSVSRESLRGQSCFAGLDLATTRDIVALTLVFPDDDGGYDVLPFFWVPEDTMRERVRRDRVPYDEWAKAGLIHITPGNACDYDVIREQIRELAEEFDIKEIAYDRWNATQLITQLTGDGATCRPMGQGMASMSPPSKELEKLVLSGSIRHGAHPVLRWMASNVAIEQDAPGNIKPSKKASTEKIDGIVALVMALDGAIRAESTGSVYDDPDYELMTA